ncbi:hypothetical protein VDGD_20634 [Verticillium dahliae]|nr:hypothetical protein VDGD_20634 [Verticillium dahliae]
MSQQSCQRPATHKSKHCLPQQWLQNLHRPPRLLRRQHNRARKRRRQIRQPVARNDRVLHEAARHAAHDARRLERQPGEVEREGHELLVGRAHERVPKQRHERPIEQQARRVVDGERQAEEAGARHERRHDGRIEPRVGRVEPGRRRRAPRRRRRRRLARAQARPREGRRRAAVRQRRLARRELDEAQRRVDRGHDVACLELGERPVEEGRERGGVGGGWRLGRRRRARGETRARAPRSRGHEAVAVVGGTLKAAGRQGGEDGDAVLGGHEDKVAVVGGDEEDGDAGEGEGRREIEDAGDDVRVGAPAATANDGEDEIGVGRQDGGLAYVRRQRFEDTVDGGPEHGARPVGVADDRGLEGRHADVEKVVLVVFCEAGQAVLWPGRRLARIARADGLRLREEGLEDGVQEVGVEHGREVDEGVLSGLSWLLGGEELVSDWRRRGPDLRGW